ncbi:MAG: hypothetical protein HY735_22520 [Verrucomicrobia bacterium]|nr:hypothetical protein [Verrucomicrobiota bacterium]
MPTFFLADRLKLWRRRFLNPLARLCCLVVRAAGCRPNRQAGSLPHASRRAPALSTVLLLIVLLTASGQAASRDADWKKVEEAVQKGLPQTAIEALEPIIQGALKDKAFGEAAKAITRKIVLEGSLQGSKPEEKIVRLEAAMAKAPKELNPLLETILAHWYWHYFQSNRWRFMQRTATAQAPGKDFTTWDLARLFEEIDKHFQAALAAAGTLKKIPVSAYDDLLPRGSLPDAYRPTLYDFIAHEALKFYTSGEQAATKPQDAFEVLAGTAVLAAAEEFIDWKIETTDSGSPIVKALRLHQELLAFHRKDQEASAFIDADLARLVYAHNIAYGEEKDSRFKAALKTLVDKWADHELSALALHHWAGQVHREGDWVEARKLAERGADVFPNSAGGRMCRNLVVEIEAKSAGIVAEGVWNAPWPKMEVRYRNIAKLHFRAVADDWERFLKRRYGGPGNLDENERRELLSKAPALEWSADLPPTDDFQERTETLTAPANLKPGFYFIVASPDPAFLERDNQISFTDVWVSDLALLLRPRDGNLEGFVLEANSGEPVTGAEVQAWMTDNQGNRRAQLLKKTDTNGFLSLDAIEKASYSVRVRHNGRELASQQDRYVGPSDVARPFERTVFFTDRAIYRPGQTIQYKGICLRVAQDQDSYDVLADRQLTAIFSDPNGKEIARQLHRCNDYGSFAGSFIAPRDRLMGRMQIHVAPGPAGSTHVSVEEYKRPKFQVTLDVPKTAAKLNVKASMGGHALSYTGAAVDGAQVKYRVVREARMPDWWGWSSWRMPRPQTSQEIAHGAAQTDSAGSFQIEFLAKPDLSVPEQDEPTFAFQIHADVTDPAGETRSAQRTIHVGYSALQASLSADEWQTEKKAVELKIRTTTLDGEPQPAEGTLKIYRLVGPAQVQRAPLGGVYPRWERGSAQQTEDLSNPNHWPLGDVAAQQGFATGAEGGAALQFQLGAGAYRAMLETQDQLGKKVTARWPIMVLKPDAAKLAVKIPHLLAAPAWSLEPGQEFLALWGTGYDAGRAFVEVEHRDKLLQRFWTQPGQTQQQITQAVTEAMRGGFTLHVTRVRENRAYLESRRIDVPWSNKDLEIRWEHFTSKVEPNQKETWTAVISATKPAGVGTAIETSGSKTKAAPLTPSLSPSDGERVDARPGDGKSLVRSLSPKSEIRNQKSEISQSLLTSAATVERVVAEMVATLYDESLDAFMKLHWPQRFWFFRQDYSTAQASFENMAKSFQWLRGQWTREYFDANQTYRSFPPFLAEGSVMYAMSPRLMERYGLIAGAARANGITQTASAETTLPRFQAGTASAAQLPTKAVSPVGEDRQNRGALSDKGAGQTDLAKSGGPDLSQVAARKNLNETAFFFPQLISDTNGVVQLQFTMPEALTQWRFLGFAHDKKLRSGFLESHTVTAKDLMVQPNPPRFLREGDTLEFTMKVLNQTPARQTGKVKLTFDEAVRSSVETLPAQGQAGSPSSVDKLLGNASPELVFDIPAKESRSFSWRIKVPDGTGFLTYKAVGSTGRVSDGEEGFLPVLSRRVFITESLPLSIRGPGTKKAEFTSLLRSGTSGTLRHQGLTVQMVSNPAWYAVMALPYLMEFPHECSEQIFNRFYANSLARFIAGSDPKIRRVFELWKNTPALDSPLEKNQDLKSVAVEETPWLRQAQSESEARKNVGILFEDNRLNYEIDRALRKLAEMQFPDGSWPWFPGGRGNDYITLYITTGFGRLRHLGAEVSIDPAVRALARLDSWIDGAYREILKRGHKDTNHLNETIALYLYGRSFFLKDKPVAPQHKEAVDYFLAQARAHWLKLAGRQSQGHVALALKRFNAFNAFNEPTPADIMKSLKERSVSNEETGRFWRDTDFSWWWHRAPIETQALMIEAFDEVAGDAQAVEDCKVWLLKQKQTQDWKTTKATADAVYALLLRGRDLLTSETLVDVTLGGTSVMDSPSPQPSPAGRGGPRPLRFKKPEAPAISPTETRSPSPWGEGRGEGDRRGGERKSETRNPKVEARLDGASATAAEPGTGFYERRFGGHEIKPNRGAITVKKSDEGIAWGGVYWQYLEDLSKVKPHRATPLKLTKTLYTKTATRKGPVLEPVKGALRVGDELVVRIELRVDRDMEYVHLKDQRGSGTEPVNVLSRYHYQDGLGYYESTRDTASHFFIDYLPKGTYVFEYSTRVVHKGAYQSGVAEIQCMYAPEFNSHSQSYNLVVR